LPKCRWASFGNIEYKKKEKKRQKGTLKGGTRPRKGKDHPEKIGSGLLTITLRGGKGEQKKILKEPEAPGGGEKGS